MSFKVTDKRLLKNYTKIWGKVSNLMDIKFDIDLFMVIMINT